MNRVVITGATSMVGVALIEECIRNGTEVLALIHKYSDKVSRIPHSERIQICECNLDEMDSFLTDQAVYDSYDVFYHLGWSHTDSCDRNDTVFQEENIKSTLNAVWLADHLGCKRFVGAGSQAEYGLCGDVISPYTSCNPKTAYGIAKLAAGRLAEIECIKCKMEYVWGRIFSVYGIYDREQTMIMSTIMHMISYQPTGFTPCEQVWDYLFTEDVGRAFWALGTSEQARGIYCVGSGEARELKSYINDIAELLHPMYELGIGNYPYNENQVMYLCADISKLTKDTGFVPMVTFKEGIKKTVQWVRSTIR